SLFQPSPPPNSASKSARGKAVLRSVVTHRQAQTIALLFVLAVLCGMATAQSSEPQLENILVRMEQAQSANPAQTPYTLTRAYRFFGSDPAQATSQVLATVEFQ